MKSSLEDNRLRRRDDDPDLQVTYPLNRCLKFLREKHAQIRDVYRERFEEVRSRFTWR
jgi:hypothetical protein